MLNTDKKIMFDYGIKIFDQSGEPKYPADDTIPDLAIISHAHLDHSGFVPALYRNSKIRWYATPPTKDFCEVLWKDSMKIMGPELPYGKSEFKKAMKYWNPMLYGKPMNFGKTKVTMHDAGHIAGAGIILAEHEGKRICYTGDLKLEETCMHKGAEPIEDIDMLIIESTYADKDHPPRKDQEKALIAEMRETIEDGGTLLLPAFSLGRTQELLSLVRKYDKDVPVYIDGMGRELTNRYIKHRDYIKRPERFSSAVNSVNLIGGYRERSAATNEPGVIISSAGMMSGGPIMGYLFNVNKKSKIIFTGFCMEDTNGHKLQTEGYIEKEGEQLYVDLPVSYLDFSAHAGRKELIEFIKKANPSKIVLVHGDAPEVFADELREAYGFDATAPILGQRIEV
jgi:putative mRNA 3-end processing factor